MNARDEVIRVTGLNDRSSRYYELVKALDAYRDQVRAEVLEEVEVRIRDAAKGQEPYGMFPEISTARNAADLVSRMADDN